MANIMKVQQIPIDTLPQPMKPVCLRFERDLKTLIDGGSITEEQFKVLCWTLEDWAVRQVKLLVGTAKGATAAKSC
jgi:hypothetical protein